MSEWNRYLRRWTYLGIFATALIALAYAGNYAAHAWNHRQLLQDALLALELGDYPEAVTLIHRVRGADPGAPEVRQLGQRLVERLTQQATLHLNRSELDEAQELVMLALQAAPESREALWLATQVAVHQERWEDAIAYGTPLLDVEDEIAVMAHCAIGNVHFMAHRATLAENHFRGALAIDPDNLFAANRIALLLTIQGRSWESRALQFHFVRQQQFTFSDLVFLANPLALMEGDLLENLRRGDPDDPLPKLGEASAALRTTEWRRAEPLLREVLEARPDLVEAHARLGEVLLERNAGPAEFAAWHGALPPGADQHPDIWAVRGLWARGQGMEEEAVRCFWEALRLDPNHQMACHQIGLVLSALGHVDEARPFRERAEKLDQLVMEADVLLRNPNNLGAARRGAELLEELGRLWEAWGWYAATTRDFPEADWAMPKRQELASRLTRATPRVVPQANPALLARRFADLPLPRFEAAAEAAAGSTIADLPEVITFADVTRQAGIDFAYYNGREWDREGHRMFEFTGGGVAVIDYDNDGWPDLYFTQGAPWPPQEDQTEYRDRLYRNMGDGTFRDVTLLAGLGDNGFGQGVAVGDFNNNGFPDLMVGNVGENRLYRNNGDGTFTDVSAEAGLDGDFWTTSCLIADLNGNGLPDIYEMNYLEGDNIFGLLCDQGGYHRTCSPAQFDGQQDRVFMNLGDGRFEEVTQQAGFVPDLPTEGKGLGLVAADFDGSGRLSVFAANDTTANFFFVNEGSPGGPLQFRELARVVGLAHDRDGRAQACMGVAIDDANGDGLINLFVTNFYSESNTFYSQQPGQFFRDETRRVGLREPSYRLLGFGTQFLDADLDGRPDLVLANGHIDDYTHDGIPYHMRPQFFRNVGGEYVELPREELGDYFASEFLGRGLARVDYNRNGREDFVVSHLYAPAALVENRTQTSNHYLTVHLRARDGARDAFGTTVQVTSDAQTRTRQLTVGDGYLASNHRQLIFGLGPATAAQTIQVRWPSGRQQTFEHVLANQEILILEGHAQPFTLR